jgi:hypothetical protein
MLRTRPAPYVAASDCGGSQAVANFWLDRFSFLGQFRRWAVRAATTGQVGGLKDPRFPRTGFPSRSGQALERMAPDGKLSPESEAKVRLLGSLPPSDFTLRPEPKNYAQ